MRVNQDIKQKLAYADGVRSRDENFELSPSGTATCELAVQQLNVTRSRTRLNEFTQLIPA